MNYVHVPANLKIMAGASAKAECNCNPIPEKLRILAIHGYRQNAETFKQKTGSFRKLVHKWAQFNYITAPHKVTNFDLEDSAIPESDAGETQDEEQYGWFFNREDLTFRGTRKGGPADGFEASVKLIEAIFEKEGPFDGILAFSQGACFAALLCDLQQRGLTKNIKFDFAILCAGFKSRCLPHLKYFMDPVITPTLHIYGENDRVIPIEMSEELAQHFEGAVVVKHSGGHYLPASSAQKHDYQQFIKLMAMQKEHALLNG